MTGRKLRESERWKRRRPRPVEVSASIEPSGKQLPQIDYALVYRERRKSLVRNLGADEAHFRALDFTINFCREHSGCDLEEAKKRVRAAVAKAGAQ
jgi:hypothetical protein